MKFFLTPFLVFLSVFGFSQCEAPLVTHTDAVNDTTFVIDFIAADNSSQYVVTFVAMYDDGVPSFFNEEFLIFNEETFFGEATAGLNTVSLDPTGAYVFPGGYPGYYYQVKLGTICNTDTLWADNFYMSTNSLLNDEVFSCQYFTMPFTFLPDIDPFDPSLVTTDVSFVVGDDLPDEIINMSLLVDIGHSFIGDLSMELTSPAGTTISLLQQTNELSSADGFSVLFQNEAPNILSNPSELGHVKGIYAPGESFNAFSGESPQGTWVLSITDNFEGDYGFLFGVGLNINEPVCDAILSGNVFFDFNANGVNDEDDFPMPFGVISSDMGTTVVGNEEGDFFYCYPQGNITLQLENIPLYYEVTPGSFSLNLGFNDYRDSIDFSLQPIGNIEDLSVDVFHYSPDRPGFENTFFVNYTNLGTTCVDNVVLEFFIDPLVQIINVESENAITVNIDEAGFTCELGTLCPFQQGSLMVDISVDQSVQIDDVLTYSATILPSVNDQNIENNSDSDSSLVVGSYDPNDIMVDYQQISTDFVSEGKSLEYVIRFQNTGNYYAENVVIRDLLDSDLISSSLVIKDASHPMTASIVGDELVFEFNDIILPASEDDEDGSHGFVRFAIRPQPDFSYNDLIENTGYIYFDYNEPIITNTVITSLFADPDIGVSEFQKSSFDLFPNPSSGVFFLVGDDYNQAFRSELYDLQGSLVSANEIKGNTLKIEGVDDGVYFIKIFNKLGEQLKVLRVVVKK